MAVATGFHHFSRAHVYKSIIIYARSRVFYYWGLGIQLNLSERSERIKYLYLTRRRSRVFYYWGLGISIG